MRASTRESKRDALLASRGSLVWCVCEFHLFFYYYRKLELFWNDFQSPPLRPCPQKWKRKEIHIFVQSCGFVWRRWRTASVARLLLFLDAISRQKALNKRRINSNPCTCVSKLELLHVGTHCEFCVQRNWIWFYKFAHLADLPARIRRLAPVSQRVDSNTHWMNHYHVDKSTGFDNTHPIDRLYWTETKSRSIKAKKTENWANMPPSLLAAVFCVCPILPPHKRRLNRAGHAIPIV